MSVYGLIGLGRAGTTAGMSLADALKELAKLRMAQQMEEERAQREFEQQKQLAQQQFLDNLMLAYLRQGNELMREYAKYMSPEQLASFGEQLQTGIQSGDLGTLAGAITELQKIGVQAAGASREDEQRRRFEQIVSSYAKEVPKQAMDEAWRLYSQGSPDWMRPLALGAADAAELERKLSAELTKARTEATKAQAEQIQTEIWRVKQLTPEQVKEIQARTKAAIARAGLDEVQAQAIVEKLPYELERLGLSNELLQKEVELAGKKVKLEDLLIEAQILKNELAQETNPLKVQELKSRIAVNESVAKLNAAREAITRAQEKGIEIDNEQKQKLWGATLQSEILGAAMKDANAGRSLLEAYRDELKKAGVDTTKLEATIKRLEDIQKRTSPEVQAAFAQVEVALDVPPKSPEERAARAEELSRKILEATGDARLAENWRNILLDAWANKIDDRTLEYLKLTLRSRANSSGDPNAWYDLQLDIAREMRQNLNTTAQTLSRLIEAKAKELNASGCVTITGIGVAYENTEECRKRYHEISNAIGDLALQYTRTMTQLQDVNAYIAMLPSFQPGSTTPHQFMQERAMERAKKAFEDEVNKVLNAKGVIREDELEQIASKISQEYGVPFAVNLDKAKQMLGDRLVTTKDVQNFRRSLDFPYAPR